MGAQAERALKFHKMREDSLTPEMKKHKKDGEQKIAFNMLKSWKVKKLLYETYGGDVIFQQAGLEPIEAFEEFLDEVEDDEKIIIHNDDYDDVFENMEDYIDADHNEIPSDAPEIQAYFSDPFWMFDPKLAEQSFAALRARIMAIPALNKNNKENQK